MSSSLVPQLIATFGGMWHQNLINPIHRIILFHGMQHQTIINPIKSYFSNVQQRLELFPWERCLPGQLRRDLRLKREGLAGKRENTRFSYVLVRLSQNVLYRKYAIGTHSKKNYGIIWEFSRSGGPHPPLLGTPYSRKKIIVYFAFQALRNIFGFHQKVNILPLLSDPGKPGVRSMGPDVRH